MYKIESMLHYFKQYLKIIFKKKIKGKNLKIQFGSGSNFIEGWINSDIPEAFSDYNRYPDAYIDITKPLPIASHSCKYLYNEHLIEHINIEDGLFFLNECYRVLKKGGVLRIATPNLNHLVKKYLSKNWKKQDWLSWPEYNFIESPAEMLNVAMRWWGHKYLYDENELQRRLKEAGFKNIKRCKLGQSSHVELNNRETRKDSKLIFEATK